MRSQNQQTEMILVMGNMYYSGSRISSINVRETHKKRNISCMNILIVDDEYYIVQGIIKNTDWEKLGIHNIFFAYSMPQAQEIFENNHIHILMTDVEMPGQNGLALISWAQQSGYQPVTVLLTGHQRFDYAKQAISLHCYSYLLKPINQQKLEEELALAYKEARQKEDREHQHPLPFSQEVSRSSFVESVKKCIIENLDSPALNRNFIADKIHMNPDYISDLFHKKAGEPLSAYINNARIHTARKLLTTTDLSLQEIAARVGFTDVSYFHRQFKKLTDMTPLQYRNANTVTGG